MSLERLQSLKPQIEKCRGEIAGYEHCVRTLDRIDRKNGNRDEQAMREHDKIRAQGRYIEKARGEAHSRGSRKGFER